MRYEFNWSVLWSGQSGGWLLQGLLTTLEISALAWILAVVLASSLFTAAYLGPIVYKAYFEEAPSPAHDRIIEVPWMVIPLVLTALASLLLGVYPNPVMSLAARVLP